MGSVTNHDRRRALEALAFWSIAQLKGVEPDNSILEKLGFGSVEALRIQLGNWEVPDWVTREEPRAEKPKAPKPAPPERKARGSGPVTELPPADNAAPLFREKLDLLARATDELKHRKEKLQAGRFLQSSMYKDPIFYRREDLPDDWWQVLTERYNLDADADSILVTDMFTWALGGGTWAPQAPLPTLIALYLLMDGEIEPLLDALYPGTPPQEVLEEIRKRIEGKKGRDKEQDGLKVLAQQLATLVRGGRIGKGRYPADIPRDEFNVASRITELRDQGWTDEDIYQQLCSSKGFARVLSSSERLSSWENFQRLADLQTRYPFS